MACDRTKQEGGRGVQPTGPWRSLCAQQPPAANSERRAQNLGQQDRRCWGDRGRALGDTVTGDGGTEDSMEDITVWSQCGPLQLGALGYVGGPGLGATGEVVKPGLWPQGQVRPPASPTPHLAGDVKGSAPKHEQGPRGLPESLGCRGIPGGPGALATVGFLWVPTPPEQNQFLHQGDSQQRRSLELAVGHGSPHSLWVPRPRRAMRQQVKGPRRLLCLQTVLETCPETQGGRKCKQL